MAKRMRIGYPDAGAYHLPAEVGFITYSGGDAILTHADSTGLTEQIGPYSSMDLSDWDVWAIPINSTDIPHIWDANGINTFIDGDWWDGSDSVRMQPPQTSDRASGLGSIFTGTGSGFPVTSLSISFEVKFGSSFCATATNATPKWAIVHTTNNLASPGSGLSNSRRPMLYMSEFMEIDNPALKLPQTYAISAGHGTVDLFGPTTFFLPTDPGVAVYPQQRQPFYFAQTAGVDGAGNPIVAHSEIFTVEFRVVTSSAYTDLPNGYIGWRVYRRNGQVFERGTTYNWDGHSVNNEWIYEIQTMGGGYYNVGRTNNVNHYTHLGGYLRLAANLDGWIGPRNGFVTGS